ncbi:nucleoside 2-deoxyribosyltransferase [Lysinibacillus composti]|uniref:Nucleoside 2-deoxyribosyltransferase n=1 Tax=Lysinibacillus composti TaxID=720633 RepID=A0A3N9UJU5_9BACI|nr:nucleoside 2-deoxyribosyltransferase [Lysinibacillus composti]MBM7607188.1 nucleoside 2-deoxyribosyltransferase [Lysinibacillus composti]RQW76227.1 nucleoside 2-deoxyribosyltransferase [Lysinibacillus composti]
MKAYLANGLFSIGDRLVNELIAIKIRAAIPGIDLYVPQENAEINDKQSFADSLAIANADMEKLEESDVLIAVLDGIEVDSGVAAEIGAFSTFNRPIVALFSDVRQLGRDNQNKIDALIADGTENQFIYRNLFVIGIIKKNGVIVSSIEEVVEQIEKLNR